MRRTCHDSVGRCGAVRCGVGEQSVAGELTHWCSFAPRKRGKLNTQRWIYTRVTGARQRVTCPAPSPNARAHTHAHAHTCSPKHEHPQTQPNRSKGSTSTRYIPLKFNFLNISHRFVYVRIRVLFYLRIYFLRNEYPHFVQL